jgi:hypothetical protein
MENRYLFRFAIIIFLWIIWLLVALIPVYVIMNGGDGRWGILYLLVASVGGGIFNLTKDWL